MLKAIWVDEVDENILSHALEEYTGTMERVEKEWPGHSVPGYMIRLRALNNRVKRGVTCK